MKKKDLVTIVTVAVISAVVSFVLSGILISSPKNRQTNVEVVSPISTEFTRPPEKYFNELSNNPTQTIQIGEENNSNPFNSR